MTREISASGHSHLMTALHPHPGLRSEKITILMPKSLVDDLRALRLVTGQSTGDLVNELLEAHLEKAQAEVEAGRAMLRIREQAQRRGEASDADDDPKPDAAAKEPRAAMPDAAFIEAWASEKGEKKGRCETQGKAYVAWCEAGGHPFDASLKQYKAEVLTVKNKPGAANTYATFVSNLIKAWTSSS